jgi:hypothetical protein
MKITKQWLKKESACSEGYQYFLSKHTNSFDASELLKNLIADKKYPWGIWILQRTLSKTDLVRLAVFSAEQVIGVFEKKYPDDDRPRKAIEAAKEYIKNPTAYAADAADAASSAAYAADAAAYAADAASYAAYAARAASYAAYAADAAAYAAYAADAAAYAADAAAYAADAIKIKILKYGLKLLKNDGA